MKTYSNGEKFPILPGWCSEYYEDCKTDIAKPNVKDENYIELFGVTPVKVEEPHVVT